MRRVHFGTVLPAAGKSHIVAFSESKFQNAYGFSLFFRTNWLLFGKKQISELESFSENRYIIGISYWHLHAQVVLL